MGFNTKRTLWVGFGFMSICAFWQIYDGIVPLILRDTFGLDGAGKGLVMAADNILRWFCCPCSDPCPTGPHTRLGRRMPYILAGTRRGGGVHAVYPSGGRPRKPAPVCRGAGPYPAVHGRLPEPHGGPDA